MFVELDSVISCTGSVCNFFFLDGGGGVGVGGFYWKKKKQKKKWEYYNFIPRHKEQAKPLVTSSYDQKSSLTK